MKKSVASASVSAVLLAASAAATGALAADRLMNEVAVQGYQLLISGKTAEAIEPFTVAINSKKLSPELLANAHLNRGLAYQRQKKYTQARDDYTAAIELGVLSSDLSAIAHYNRGLAHHKLEKLGLAIEDFTEALLKRADLAQAYYGRANALRDAGQYLFALGDYDKALKYQHPKPHFAHYGMALTFEKLAYTKHAKKSLVAALDANPDFTPARQRLATLSGKASAAVAQAPKATDTALTVDNNVLLTSFDRVPTDNIVTGSIATPEKPDLELRKKEMPAPVAPNFAIGNPSTETAQFTQAPINAAQSPARVVKVNVPPDNIAQPISLLPEAEQARVVEARLPDTTADIDAEPSNDLSGWTVQLSSQGSEKGAWNVWTKLKKKHGNLLKSHKPIVVRADLGDRGIYYRLRVHEIASKQSARKLCGSLKKKGSGCFVQHADS